MDALTAKYQPLMAGWHRFMDWSKLSIVRSCIFFLASHSISFFELSVFEPKNLLSRKKIAHSSFVEVQLFSFGVLLSALDVVPVDSVIVDVLVIVGGTIVDD